jgi:hypothetical protein
MPRGPQPFRVPAEGMRAPLISKPPILASPEPGKTLLLYVVATTQVISATLIVERMELEHVYKIQMPVYYISNVLSRLQEKKTVGGSTFVYVQPTQPITAHHTVRTNKKEPQPKIELKTIGGIVYASHNIVELVQ